MVKEICVIFLIGHMLGDYYFQSANISQGKKKSFKLLAAHGTIYLCILTGIVGAVFGVEGLKYCLLLSIIHIFIDCLQIFADRYFNKSGQKNAFIYVVDQILHILAMIAASILISMRGGITGYSSWVCEMCSYIHISADMVFAWLSAFLVVLTPCCFTIRIVLEPVARYNRISEDAVFAEYYLLGTLLSTALVLGVYKMIF